MSTRELTVVQVFDWYDGIVVGLVRPSWKDEIRLASLISFDPDSKQRAYALYPVSIEQIATLIALEKKRSDELFAALRAICRATNDMVEVVRVDGRTDKVVTKYNVRALELLDDVLLGIDNAIDPARRHWLDPPERG